MRIADIYPCLESVSDKRIKVSVLIKQEQKIPQGNWRHLPPHSEKKNVLELHWYMLVNCESLVFLCLR